MAIEIFFLFLLYILGAGFHVMQKIGKIKTQYPELAPKVVFNTFFKEEWNTLIVSALGLICLQAIWFIIHHENIKHPQWLHEGGIYGIFLVSGYCLQRLIYKILGTAEKVIGDKVDISSGISWE
jgi:hypothetical protein